MIESITPYVAVIRIRMRVALQYRAAAIAGFGTQLFWGLIRVAIFTAFYGSSLLTQPMSLPDTISYCWLGQAMLSLLPWSVDPDIKSMIRSGAVVYELTRPLDLYSLWYVRGMALRVTSMALRSIPMFLIAGSFLGLKSPNGIRGAVAWVASTLGAILLGSAIANLLNISMLWTISAEGISRLAPSLMLVLSGMLLPLPLFPKSMQGVLRALPFGDLVDVPFRFYTGSIAASELPARLVHQIVWTVILVVAGRSLLRIGVRRMVTQGG